MPIVAILFLVAFVPSLQAGLSIERKERIEHILNSEIKKWQRDQAMQSAEIVQCGARYCAIVHSNTANYFLE